MRCLYLEGELGCQIRSDKACFYILAQENCPDYIPETKGIRGWNEIVSEANLLKEKIEAVHEIACREANFDLKRVYEEMLDDYSKLIEELRALDPAYIRAKAEECLLELNKLEDEMRALEKILEETGDKIVEAELESKIYRSVRLLDQASILGGVWKKETNLKR